MDCKLTDCQCEECSEEVRAMMCEQLQTAKKALASVEYRLRQPGYVELYEEDADKLMRAWYDVKQILDRFEGGPQ